MPVAVISGANRGIGLELTRQYLNDGWHVRALVRTASAALDELSASGRLTIVTTDLTDDSSLRGAVEAIPDPAVDLLINNAGTMGNGRFEEEWMQFQAFGKFDRNEWHEVFDINVMTPQALTELLADKLAASDRGVAVTITSMLGSNELNSTGSLYAYRASKAAVNSIMRSMGHDLGKRGIIALALHPGWVKTDMGGAAADIDAVESVTGLRKVIARATLEDSGRFFSYDGSAMPW